MKILLADDDKVTRIRLTAYLHGWGHEVLAAADGLEAWERFRKEPCWLVVSDWQMPGMNGVELVQRIRADAKPGNYVYVILLTSRSEKSDLVEGMEAGADDFVSKPFDKEELRVRIRAGERVIQLERALAEGYQQLAAVNSRMRESLEAAARIQRAFLPKTGQVFPGVQAAWRYLPCDELAGDTLNILCLDDEHLCFYVADVCGHGVAASLLSITLSRLMSKGAGTEGVLIRHRPDGDAPEPVGPAEVARHLNERFPWNPEAMEYFTLFYGLLNVRTRQLRYVCAGHPRPVLVPATAPAERLLSDPPAVGLLPGAEFVEHTMRLAPGDRLYAFTDGLVEALSPVEEEFGEERLVAAAATRRSRDLPDSIHALVEDVDAWRGRGEPADDQCIIGLEIT